MIILDRFESNSAIIETNDEDGAFSVIRVDKQLVAADVSEGDVLLYEEGKYFTDVETTAKRRERIKRRIRRIKKTQSEN